MKLSINIFIALLFFLLQNNGFAANNITDKQLLQAYNLLIKKTEKKAIIKSTNNAKKPSANTQKRTPQINATLVAKKQINRKYRWGGSNPYTGFDCSGLMQYAYKASRVYLPRTAAAQYKHTKRISSSSESCWYLSRWWEIHTCSKKREIGIN